jgi:hypothetical protein
MQLKLKEKKVKKKTQEKSTILNLNGKFFLYVNQKLQIGLNLLQMEEENFFQKKDPSY